MTTEMKIGRMWVTCRLSTVNQVLDFLISIGDAAKYAKIVYNAEDKVYIVFY